MRIIPHITLKGTFCNLQQGVIKVGKKRIKKQIYKPIKKRIKRTRQTKKLTSQNWKAKAKAKSELKNDNFLTSKKNPVCKCNVHLLKRVSQTVVCPTNGLYT